MQRLLSDMTEVGAFIAAQRNINRDVDELIDKQCAAFIKRMNHLSEFMGAIDTCDATRLTTVVLHGPWTPDHQRLMADRINAWHMNDACPKPMARKLQSCLYIEHYYPDDVIARLMKSSPSFLESEPARVALCCQLPIISASRVPASRRLVESLRWSYGLRTRILPKIALRTCSTLSRRLSR